MFKQNIKTVRNKISQLNYLQREIMILHYIDELPVKEIAQHLNITESNVKWHLYDSRKKLKEEIENMNPMNNEYIYRPGKLSVAFSGSSGEELDTEKINESLTKQNICLCCYKSPKTLDELAEMMNIPKAYIEFDLEWLVKREFIEHKKGRYSTVFSISDENYMIESENIFFENKESFCDIIVNKLISYRDRIKAIGFYGSDSSINKILWLLIYKYIGFVSWRVCYEENIYPAERPIRPDGGKYFPIGYEESYIPKHKLTPYMNSQYKDIKNWGMRGSMGNEFGWQWMRICPQEFEEFSSVWRIYQGSHKMKYVNLLIKLRQPNFDIHLLTEDEKLTLSEVLSYGWVKKDGDKFIPNFWIFTKEQNNKLTEIFEEIYEETKDEAYRMFDIIKNFCLRNRPEQIKSHINHSIFMAFYFACKIITGFAYYDGLLYIPEHEYEYEYDLLTFQMIV